MVQVGRPVADEANADEWVTEAGLSSSIYASIDESTLDTADYVTDRPLPFLEDEMDGTSGTLLSAHSHNVGGGAWTQHPLFSATAAISNANRARSTTGGGRRVYYAAPVSPSANYDVDFEVHAVGTDRSVIITGRQSTTADTMYAVLHTLVGDYWLLYKHVAGVFTALDTQWSDTIAAGTSREGRLSIRDSVKKLYIKSGGVWVERQSSTDNSITAAGRVGIEFSTDGSDSAGIHVERIQARAA